MTPSNVRGPAGSIAAVLAATAVASLMSATVAWGEGILKLEWKTAGGGTIRIYGQLDQGILYYDDGYESRTYAPVDNNAQSSRLGITYTNTFVDSKFEARVEAEYKPYSSNNISIVNDEPNWEWARTNFRKIEISIDNDRYGKLWLGQGSMASDGTAEVDVSGTRVIAYSLVSDTAGGQLFRASDDPAEFGPAVKSAFNNYDGLSRKMRVRYDTPKIADYFGIQTSYGTDALASNETKLFDVAATYDSKDSLGDFKMQAAIAYAWQENDVEIFDGSASLIHDPTGLNLTVAAGSQDDDEKSGRYIYGKLGLLRDYVDWGKTAFAVDYYTGTDIADAGTDSQSVGLAVVQNVKDWNMELWLTYREYMYDGDTTDFKNGHAIFGGTRIQF